MDKQESTLLPLSSSLVFSSNHFIVASAAPTLSPNFYFSRLPPLQLLLDWHCQRDGVSIFNQLWLIKDFIILLGSIYVFNLVPLFDFIRYGATPLILLAPPSSLWYRKVYMTRTIEVFSEIGYWLVLCSIPTLVDCLFSLPPSPPPYM